MVSELEREKEKSLNRVQLLATRWTVAYRTLLSMGSSLQEYWSGLPFPPPGDLPDPGKEPKSLHCRQMLYRLSYQGTQLVMNHLQCRRLGFDSWVRKICWRRDRLPTPVYLGFPCGSAGKDSAHNAGDWGSIPGLGRSPGKGKSYPLQNSGLENSMNSIVHGVAKELDLNRKRYIYQNI